MKKIITAAAISLFLSPAAFAAGTSTSAQGVPDDWNSEIKNAFFTDAEAGTLRSQTEIKDNWSKLSSDQQAKVKSDCSNMQASAGSSATGSSSDTMASDQSSGSSGSADSSSNMTTGSTTSDDTSGSSGASGSSGTTSAMNSDSSSGSSGSSGSSSAMGSGDQMAAVQKVCDWVKSM